MSGPQISSELKFRSLEFLKKLEDDLLEANENYGKVAEEIEEYVNVKMFLDKEIEFGDKSERNIMTNIGCNIYTKAKIPANSKIIVCLIDDIFVEMDYQRAEKFLERKLEILNQKLDQIGKQMAAIRGHIMFVHAAMDPSGVLQRIE
ncbi:unnamed protein product [Bursaphelenchus xylophilus]|uniref:(pine wood nematode) hypothetical protein n=1 Tax=Bursaphelenchus xylophilus TaxID=6326 RepID=A0A1I7RHZ5_BURXY|nr:unnamed protein product [Bursaphelenchus xylophilus]CAG9115267.1 unnamed protein product [Bursaphelenchus xylophilus]